MLTRRQFLHVTTTTAGATVAVLVLPACGSDDNAVIVAPAPTVPSCDGILETSSYVVDHVHEVCVPRGDVVTPPATGNTYETTFDSGHSHRITVNAAELATLRAGGNVVKTTSVDDSHTHVFTLVGTDLKA